MKTRDPLSDPAPLVQRVYAYVAYRVGDGPDAEDITSEVFERALRYSSSYDADRGSPIAWLIGIARRCIDGRPRPLATGEIPEHAQASPEDVEADAVQRLALAAAVARLDARSQDLVALRYGADLTAREIGRMLELKRNAVDVAIHRALARLRQELERTEQAPRPRGVSRTAPSGSAP